MAWCLDRVSLTYRLFDGSCVRALREVSIEIRAGDRVAIVGPNGSGKSALALCLAGLIKPTSGQIDAGRQQADPEEPWAAIVFQNPDDNLITQSVIEEVALTLEHAIHEPVSESDIGEVLERFQLSHVADRELLHLSGGEKQRLAVACAFAANRPLIVLDEPTSHLDPPSRQRLIERLIDSSATVGPNGDSTTVVLVTQYPSEARQFDRVIQLENGRVAFDGSCDEWRPPIIKESDLLPAPETGERQPVISAAGLYQVEQPGWPLPPKPLDGINVTIFSGDAIGLCGPIGAGKSTLACHLAGLVRQYRGEIRGDSPAGNHCSPVVLVQFPERQLFCPTVLEDIAWGPKHKGVSSGEAIDLARSLIDRLGMPPSQFAERSPFALSGGQRRRVALSGVAACPASLYILDEPSAALDREGMLRLQGLFKEWRRAGTPYVIISHDLDWLRHVTARAWIMDAGHVCYDGHWSDGSRIDQVLFEIGFW